MKKYKSLQQLVNISAGTTFEWSYSNNAYMVKSLNSAIKLTMEDMKNEKWFAEHILTTSDGVEVYVGEEYFVACDKDVVIKNKAQKSCHIHNTDKSIVDRRFSTKQAALLHIAKAKYPVGTRVKGIFQNVYQVISKHEGTVFKVDSEKKDNIWMPIEKNLNGYERVPIYFDGQWAEIIPEPKFKLGDYLILTTNLPSVKAGSLCMVSTKGMYQTHNTFLDIKWLSICGQMDGGYFPHHFRLATHEEILSYYKEKGWINGARFRLKGGIDKDVKVVSNIGFMNSNTSSLAVSYFPESYADIRICELVVEPEYKVGDIVIDYNGTGVITEFTTRHRTDFMVDKVAIIKYSDNKHALMELKHLLHATEQEKIAYYESLGWKRGAKFTSQASNNILTVSKIGFIKDALYITIAPARIVRMTNCKLVQEKELPKSWEELSQVKGYYIDLSSRISNVPTREVEVIAKKTFKTKAQAESALAYAQLSQLVAEYNGDWVADWSNYQQLKYVIVRRDVRLVGMVHQTGFESLAFKSSELRDYSLKHHRELWKQYWQL